MADFLNDNKQSKADIYKDFTDTISSKKSSSTSSQTTPIDTNQFRQSIAESKRKDVFDANTVSRDRQRERILNRRDQSRLYSSRVVSQTDLPQSKAEKFRDYTDSPDFRKFEIDTVDERTVGEIKEQRKGVTELKQSKAFQREKALVQEQVDIAKRYGLNEEGQVEITDPVDKARFQQIQKERDSPELRQVQEQAQSLTERGRELGSVVPLLQETQQAEVEKTERDLRRLQRLKNELEASEKRGDDYSLDYMGKQRQYNRELNALRGFLGKEEVPLTTEALSSIPTRSLVYADKEQLETFRKKGVEPIFEVSLSADKLRRWDQTGWAGRITKVAMPTIDPFIPKSSKTASLLTATSIAGTAATFGVGSALTGGSFVTGVATGGRFATQVAVGSQAPRFARALDEDFGSESQKVFLERPDSIDAFRAGVAGERQEIGGGVRGFISDIPLGTKFIPQVGSREGFKEGVREYYTSQGLTGKELETAVEAQMGQRTASYIGEPIGAIAGAEAPAELAGRTLFKSLVKPTTTSQLKAFGSIYLKTAPGLAAAGTLEGVGSALTQQATYREDFDAGRTIESGVFGAVMAPAVGGVVAGFAGASSVAKKGAKTASRGRFITQTGASLWDLPEVPGDIFASAQQRSARGVRTLSNRFRPKVSTPFSINTESSIMEQTTQNQFTTSFNVPSVSEINIQLSEQVPISSEVSLTQNVFSNVPSRVSVPSQVPSTSTQPSITTPIPEIQSTFSVPTSAQVPTTSQVPTSLNVPTVVPVEEEGLIFPPLFLPGRGRKKKGKKRKIKTQYTPSFDAIALGITAKKGFKKKKLYTGIETRPLLK